MSNALITLLETHANRTLERSPTSALYVARVRQNALKVGELLTSGTGEVKSVVSTWRGEFRPIAEAVFGLTIGLRDTDQLQMTHAEFMPTVIDGIMGRVTRLSDDEIMGPLLSLDLRAKNT